MKLIIERARDGEFYFYLEQPDHFRRMQRLPARDGGRGGIKRLTKSVLDMKSSFAEMPRGRWYVAFDLARAPK